MHFYSYKEWHQIGLFFLQTNLMIRFFYSAAFLIFMHFSAAGQWNMTIDTIMLNPVKVRYTCSSIVSQDVTLTYTGNGDYPLCTYPSSIGFSLSDDAGTFNGVTASDAVSGDWKPYFSYQMNVEKTRLRATQIAPIPSSLKVLNVHLKLSTKMGSPVNGFFGAIGQVAEISDESSCLVDVNTDPGEDFAYTSASVNCVLPVLLQLFTAEKLNDDSVISWESDIEYNFDYYSIEHSTNAVNFIEIVSVSGNGNKSTYKYLHSSPSKGLNYYRLKMVDLDGTFVYSDVKAVNFSTERNSLLNVYPNPFSQVFTIANLQTPSDITVFDVTGKLIHKMSVSDSHVLMDLSQHPSGIYSVNIKDKLNTKVFRVIKS